MQMTYAPTLFAEAARSIGLHPFPTPSANLSGNYVNSLGVAMAQCTLCGFCERFACANYSKSSPQSCVLPVLMRKRNFELRTNSEVLRIDLHRPLARILAVAMDESVWSLATASSISSMYDCISRKLSIAIA